MLHRLPPANNRGYHFTRLTRQTNHHAATTYGKSAAQTFRDQPPVRTGPISQEPQAAGGEMTPAILRSIGAFIVLWTLLLASFSTGFFEMVNWALTHDQRQVHPSDSIR